MVTKKILLIGMIFLMSCALKPRVMEEYEAGRASEKAAVIYERGNTFFKQKDYRNAIKELEVVLEKYENTTAYEPALYLTAFSHYKLNNFKDAASLGEKFLKSFPNSNYLLNATSLVGESNYKLVEDYKAAYYLTKFYTLSDDESARKQALNHVIDVLPKLSLDQLEKLHRVFMANPIDEHILYTLAQIEAREGKKREAERDFNLLTRRFPNTKYTAEVTEYIKYIGLGDVTARAGILLPLTGTYAHVGSKLIEIINIFKKNKYLPFSLHFLDTKSDPIDATIAAAQLIDDVNVDFLIAPVPISSGEAFGVCGVAYGKGIPVILPMTSEPKFESIPNIFTHGHTSDDQARVIADYAIFNLGIRRFAVLYPDIPKYRVAADVFARQVTRNNREVVAMVSFNPDSITLKGELTGIKDREPEAIFLPMDMNMVINTTPQIAYYGVENAQILGLESFMDEKIPRLGETYVDGAVFVAPAASDSMTLNMLRNQGIKQDDFAAKFYYTLWQLRELQDYNRNTLADQLEDIMREQEVYNIYTIKDGEFEQLTQITK